MSKDVPVGYKLTEVGVIPEDWEIQFLRETCIKIQDGTHFSPSLGGNDYMYVTSKNIGRGIFDISNVDKIDCIQHRKIYNRCDVKKGDLLLTKDGVNTGNAALNFLDEEFSLLSSVAFLRFDSSKYEVSYFLQQILFSDGQRQIRELMVGNAITRLTLGKIRSLKFPIPVIEEQRSIALVLSDTDALITSLDKLIAKKRDIKQAAMQQLLTGKQRLDGFGDSSGKFKQTEIGLIPEDWDVKPLKTISSMNGRIGWQGLKQEEFTFKEDDPFLITGMNFKDGKIRWEEVYHIPEKRYQEARNIQLKINDILMTKDGTIGKLLFVDDIPFPNKASLNSHLLVFRPLNQAYEPKFLFYQLDSKHFADHIDLNKSGSTFFGITQEAVGKYSAYLPPLEEQQAIAKVLSDMDNEISALEQRRDKTKALKQAMMQELLTGRIRLHEKL